MSFLRNYDLLSSGNEAPAVFHTWAGLSALSSIVSRRVWIDMGRFTIYPNMYILFVGNPGIKKTTAMDIAEGLVLDVGTIPVCPPSITREACTQLMAEKDSPCIKKFKFGSEVRTYTHLSIYASELVSLINAGGNAAGWIEFLTDIWDRKVYIVKTKNKGTDNIHGPFVTLLGCLTPSTMSTLAAGKIISSGFSRRCVFVYSEDFGDPVPIPKITDEQEEAWKKCVARGRELQKVSGQFGITGPALNLWTEIYKEIHASKVSTDSDFRQGLLQSKDGYILKIAMLTTLSESNNLVIDEDHLLLAKGIYEQIEGNMAIAFEGAGRNEQSPIAAQIERMVLSKDEPVLKKQIYAVFYKDAKTEEIDAMLAHLARVGKICLFDATRTGSVIPMVSSPEVFSRLPKAGDQQG